MCISQTPAMLHGNNYEVKAIKLFEKIRFLPDAVIDEDIILEVRCPFKGRKVKYYLNQNFN